jgi:WD40 repeat protein
MKIIIIQITLMVCFSACNAQPDFGTEKLKLEQVIDMPGVSGRIDHMAVNLKDKVLYVAALGNNTVEAIDLQKGTLLQSIKGVVEPQGLAYIPEQNEIAVASGSNGDCVFYNATTFQKVATVHLAGDADNIRYDANERKMYVGYGNGGMAMIDPASHKQIGDVKLAAHPESFQLDKKNDRLYVNLPDDHSISVIDLKSFKVTDTWKINSLRANFPMTLDTVSNQVIIGFRHPSVLVFYDVKTSKEITRNELVGDVDDVFYDAAKQQVLASGGGGYINIFQKSTGNTYKLVSKIASRDGARTSFLAPSIRSFIVAERAAGGKSAAIAVYKIMD